MAALHVWHVSRDSVTARHAVSAPRLLDWHGAGNISDISVIFVAFLWRTSGKLKHLCFFLPCGLALSRVWWGCCRWGWERSDDDRKLAPTLDCDSPDTNGSICGDQPRFANITPEHAKTLLQKYLHKSHNGHRVSRAWAATSTVTVCRGR